MKSIGTLLLTSFVAATIGYLAGSVTMSRAGTGSAEPAISEEVEAGFRATVMALSSLAVDSEINARNIAELEGRLARMENKLEALTPR